MALSSRKRLALHIGTCKSSMVSSLFTVCRPERTMLGPAHATNFLSCALWNSNFPNSVTVGPYNIIVTQCL